MYYGLYHFIYIDVKMILLTLSDQIALYSSLFFLEMCLKENDKDCLHGKTGFVSENFVGWKI